jgi:disulfide oxidoreductase YuzD
MSMSHRRLFMKLCMVVTALALVAACATAPATAKEKAVWMMGIYNRQFDDYQVMVARPDLTDAQKEILRQKKKVLVELKPLIAAYDGYVQQDAAPSPQLEAQITDLLNQLQTKVSK